jgi:uncharacterized repeat protein (TIGR01451 family)
MKSRPSAPGGGGRALPLWSAVIGCAALVVQNASSRPAASAPPSPPAGAAWYRIEEIGLANGQRSRATAIGSNGFVSGASEIGQQDAEGMPVEHAFRASSGGTADLGAMLKQRELGSGHSVTHGAADGERARVAGSMRDADGNTRAFFYREGGGLITSFALQVLGTLGGKSSAAYDFNSHNQIVGGSETAALDPAGKPIEHAFLWQDETMTDLGTLGGSFSTDISESGLVAGVSTLSSGAVRGFLWQNGQMTEVGTLDGVESRATGVNEQGEVVQMTDLDPTGAQPSYALDVNNRGVVVGKARRADGSFYAVLWQDGERIDLNTRLPAGSGWTLEEAVGVNDLGQVAGNGIYNGVRRGFRLDPVASDLSVRAKTSRDPEVGKPLTLWFVLQNHGPADATGVQFSTTLPPSLTFAAASPGCTYDPATRVVSLTLGKLLNQMQHEISIDVMPTLAEYVEVPGGATNTVEPDMDMEDNVHSLAVSIATASADLRLGDRPSAPITAAVGSVKTVSLRVYNSVDAGNRRAASNVRVTYQVTGNVQASPPASILASLPSDSSRPVSFALTPTSPGTIIVDCTVTADQRVQFSELARVRVTITAEGGSLQVSPPHGSRLPFGSVASTSNGSIASAVQYVTVTQSGAGSIRYRVSAISANRPDFFQWKEGGTGEFEASSTPKRFGFAFAPKASGPMTGTVTFTELNTAAQKSHQIHLDGTGVTTTLTASVVQPFPIETEVGLTRSATVRVQNAPGGPSVTISSLSIGAPFSVPTGSFSLAGGAYRDVVVSFKTDTAALHSGVLRIRSSAPGVPAEGLPVTLQARAVPAKTGRLTVSSFTLAFGYVPRNTTKEMSLILQNTGGSPLWLAIGPSSLTAPYTYVTGEVLKVGWTGDRVVKSDMAMSGRLRPSGRLVLKIRMRPTDLGSAFEVIDLESDDPTRRIESVFLTGYGR